ncbi:MAG: hypothetical protein J6K17_12340 [Oscillospiraceae bacterium]|nr:hypothetical protein [Oscillospiraceae bacterium]
MKKNRLAKLAVLLAAAMTLTVNSLAVNVFAEDNGAVTSEIVIDGNSIPGNDIAITTRALEEGDTYAINKINPKTTGDVLAGGYQLVDENIDAQGKLYMNGGSKVIIRAQNYNEDMQDMTTWADNACAMMRIANFTSACDTVFAEPQQVKVCGYDAIMYDYDVIQYEFIDNTTKQQIDTFKGRNYYFYSDKDAYVIMFDTNDETYEEQLKNFEEFVDDLQVQKTTKKIDIKIIISACAAVAIVAVVAVICVFSKKKKKE